MKTKQKTRMIFICDQNWDEMVITTNGRFCNLCKKEVIDFTSEKINVIQGNKKETDGSLCGRFRIEQIDTTLIKPIEVPRKIKYFAFISSLLLTISAKTSFGQTKDSLKTEQLESKSDKLSRTPYYVSTSKDEELAKEFANKTPFLANERKRYYWTRNFPFVKSVKIKRHNSYVNGRILE